MGIVITNWNILSRIDFPLHKCLNHNILLLLNSSALWVGQGFKNVFKYVEFLTIGIKLAEYTDIRFERKSILGASLALVFTGKYHKFKSYRADSKIRVRGDIRALFCLLRTFQFNGLKFTWMFEAKKAGSGR